MNWKRLALLGGMVVTVGSAFGAFWYIDQQPATLLQLHGVVEIQEVRLSSKVGGRVERIAVDEGHLVEPGQPLVYFEVPELKAQRQGWVARMAAAEAELAKARSGPRDHEKQAAHAAMVAAQARLARLRSGYRAEEIEQAKNELEAAEAEMERAAKDWDREQPLYRSGALSQTQQDATLGAYKRLHGLAKAARARLRMLESGSRPEEIAEAQAEWDQATANYELLRLGTRTEDIELAEARLNETRAKLQELDVQLGEAVIRAPENAVVEVLSARPGDIVPANQPVVRVLRAEDLWVKAYVSEIDLGKLRLNQPVEVSIDAFPGRRFQGHVAQIASISEFTPRNVQSADERRHQVFAIKVRVEDCGGVFKSGMAADVWMQL